MTRNSDTIKTLGHTHRIVGYVCDCSDNGATNK